MLLLQLGQHLRELALQDVVVRDQLRTPAAGEDGLQVRGQQLVEGTLEMINQVAR